MFYVLVCVWCTKCNFIVVHACFDVDLRSTSKQQQTKTMIKNYDDRISIIIIPIIINAQDASMLSKIYLHLQICKTLPRLIDFNDKDAQRTNSVNVQLQLEQRAPLIMLLSISITIHTETFESDTNHYQLHQTNSKYERVSRVIHPLSC